MPPRKSPARSRKFWLFKSEPESFSINDLAKAPRQITCWDGVRNYQARNLLRDDIQVGDGVLFYHSSTEPMAIVGTAKVVRNGYADHTAFDPKSNHYDPGSSPDEPTWFMVDIQLVQQFSEPLTRAALQAAAELNDMLLLKRGSRLSVQPVTEAEWKTIHKLAGVKDKA